MSFKWQDPSLSLGERCVAFAENEMANGVKEDKPHSYTSPRLKEYFSICTRNINGKETKINLTAGNWCAASASFCLHESLLPGEISPHGYRLGVVEIVADLQHNNLYHGINDVRSGKFNPVKGDLIIFDRSTPGNPATQWFRHIGRVYSINQNHLQCISGNSAGGWRITSHELSQPNLLGFGEYPDLNSKIVVNNNLIPVPSWLNASELNLAPTEDTGSGIDVSEFYDEFNKIFGNS